MAGSDNSLQERFHLDFLEFQNQTKKTFTAAPLAAPTQHNKPLGESTVRLRKERSELEDIEMLDLSSMQQDNANRSTHKQNRQKSHEVPMEIDMSAAMTNDMHKLIEAIDATACIETGTQLCTTEKLKMDRFLLPLIGHITSDSSDSQLKLRAMRKIEDLTIKGYPILSYLIERQIVPLLVDCLKMQTQPLLQVEAILSIINITRFKNSDFRKKIIYAGAVPLLIQLINSAEQEVSLKALHAINALVFNEPQIREYVTRNGLTQALQNYLKTKPANSNLLMIVHHISHFKGFPPPPPEVVPDLLDILNKIIEQPQIGLIYFALISIKQLAHVFKYKSMIAQVDGLVPKLISFFAHSEVHVQKAAILTITSVLFFRREQQQLSLYNSMLPHFPNLLTHRCKAICRVAMALLAKLTGCSELQVQPVIDAQLLPKIIEVLCNSAFEIQRFAIEVVHNLIEYGNRQQIFAIIRAGVLPPLCNFLTCHNPDIIYLVLGDLNKMLEIADTHWLELANLIEECDGLDKIESLQYHENVRIYLLALDIIERYFSGETQQELNLQPKSDNTQFYFDMNAGGDQSYTFDF